MNLRQIAGGIATLLSSIGLAGRSIHGEGTVGAGKMASPPGLVVVGRRIPDLDGTLRRSLMNLSLMNSGVVRFMPFHVAHD